MTHFYDKEGMSHHTIVGVNGTERDSTLRDARKFGWLPSVTGIIDQLDKPALTRWKLDKLAEEMALESFHEYWNNLELPLGNSSHYANYIKKNKEAAMQPAIIARDKGARIHKAVEQVYSGEDCDKEYMPYVKAITDLLNEKFGVRDWYSEETFANELGYGGTADLFCHQATLSTGDLPGIVVDFKTKDFDESKPPKGYPEQAMQLEACANGLGIPDALIYNVFISRTNPGVVSIYPHDKADYFEQFKLLLELWKRRNKYKC